MLPEGEKKDMLCRGITTLTKNDNKKEKITADLLSEIMQKTTNIYKECYFRILYPAKIFSKIKAKYSLFTSSPTL